jgi:hypothetical protein
MNASASADAGRFARASAACASEDRSTRAGAGELALEVPGDLRLMIRNVTSRSYHRPGAGGVAIFAARALGPYDAAVGGPSSTSIVVADSATPSHVVPATVVIAPAIPR